MKIGFSTKLSFDISGKHNFFKRLSEQFKKLGTTIDNKRPDINIFLPGDNICKNSKNVLRLNGLIIDKNVDYKSKNNKILRSIQQSDAIVYQNEFCKLAYSRFLKVNKKPNACILNGASQSEFLPRQQKNYFLANCKWRPHKRLKDIIDSFVIAISMGLDADLVVTGEANYVVNNDHIKYIGWQTQSELKKLLSEAVATIHLSWIDWCPNAMVESVVAKCPVIYSDSGGHPYIGSKCGISISDTQWDFLPCDYYHPPQISLQEVAQAMCNISKLDHDICNENVYIENVAKQYLDFFEQI